MYSQDQVVAFLLLENCWTKVTSYCVSDGIKTIYRCKRVRRRGAQCAAKIYIHYDKENKDFKLFRKNVEHTCDVIGKPPVGIEEYVKVKIIQLLHVKYTLKSIMFHLRKDKEVLKMPTLNQVKYVIQKYRNEKYGDSSISLGELSQFMGDRMVVPDDEDQAFVLKMETSTEDDHENLCERWFRFFITTKRLLMRSVDAKIIHADSTYKIMVEGFALNVFGTSDANKKFHLIGFSFCTKEDEADYIFSFESIRTGALEIFGTAITPKILVTDGACAIINGFKTVFESHEITIMCYFHLKERLKANVTKLNNKDCLDEILVDVDELQKCYNNVIFEKALQLFLRKYNVKETNFIKYFEEQWVNLHPNWHEGASPHTPSTNNCLESFNHLIKQHQTFYKRMKVNEFKTTIFDMTEDWSREYLQDKVFDKVPSISRKLWKESYTFAKLNTSIIIRKSTCKNFNNCYLLNNGETITTKHINSFLKMNFGSFDKFKEKAFNVCCVTMPIENEKWDESTCVCVGFQKNYICKHVIGLAIRTRAVKIPSSLRDAPIEPKKKRGRPNKAKKALIRQ